MASPIWGRRLNPVRSLSQAWAIASLTLFGDHANLASGYFNPEPDLCPALATTLQEAHLAVAAFALHGLQTA
jgi:hypothetical protein